MALVGVARAENATQLVLGASRRSTARERLGGSIVAAVLRAAGELDVHVISSDAEAAEPSPRIGAVRQPRPRQCPPPCWPVRRSR